MAANTRSRLFSANADNCSKAAIVPRYLVKARNTQRPAQTNTDPTRQYSTEPKPFHDLHTPITQAIAIKLGMTMQQDQGVDNDP